MKKLLEECNQSHILKYWNDLNEDQQKEFLQQLKQIDFKAALWMWQKAHEDLEKTENVNEDDLTPVDLQVIFFTSFDLSKCS